MTEEPTFGQVDTNRHWQIAERWLRQFDYPIHSRSPETEDQCSHSCAAATMSHSVEIKEVNEAVPASEEALIEVPASVSPPSSQRRGTAAQR
jgi:hypothetical protein